MIVRAVFQLLIVLFVFAVLCAGLFAYNHFIARGRPLFFIAPALFLFGILWWQVAKQPPSYYSTSLDYVYFTAEEEERFTRPIRVAVGASYPAYVSPASKEWIHSHSELKVFMIYLRNWYHQVSDPVITSSQSDIVSLVKNDEDVLEFVALKPGTSKVRFEFSRGSIKPIDFTFEVVKPDKVLLLSEEQAIAVGVNELDLASTSNQGHFIRAHGMRIHPISYFFLDKQGNELLAQGVTRGFTFQSKGSSEVRQMPVPPLHDTGFYLPPDQKSPIVVYDQAEEPISTIHFYESEDLEWKAFAILEKEPFIDSEESHDSQCASSRRRKSHMKGKKFNEFIRISLQAFVPGTEIPIHNRSELERSIQAQQFRIEGSDIQGQIERNGYVHSLDGGCYFESFLKPGTSSFLISEIAYRSGHTTNVTLYPIGGEDVLHNAEDLTDIPLQTSPIEITLDTTKIKEGRKIEVPVKVLKWEKPMTVSIPKPKK